jgi:UDP-N-acetylglucosamine acyltransferase
MATRIHPTAIVAAGAELGENVTVGPYAIIDEQVRIGDNCQIDSLARVCNYTEVGQGCHVFHGAVLGEVPQDAKFKGEVSYLKVGEDNQIREYMSIHRASGEGESTIVGSHNMFMAYAHVGHNARVGDNTLIASYAGVSGHCVVEDYANIAGFVGIHQYAVIGTMAMIGGMSRVVTDIPPYCIAQGNPSELHGLNYRGLIRRGVSDQTRSALKHAYRLLFRTDCTTTEAAERIRAEVEVTPEVERLVSFQLAVADGFGGRQLDPHGRRK